MPLLTYRLIQANSDTMRSVFPSSSVIWGVGGRLWPCFRAKEGEDPRELCCPDGERRNSLYMHGGLSGPIFYSFWILTNKTFEIWKNSLRMILEFHLVFYIFFQIFLFIWNFWIWILKFIEFLIQSCPNPPNFEKINYIFKPNLLGDGPRVLLVDAITFGSRSHAQRELHQSWCSAAGLSTVIIGRLLSGLSMNGLKTS
jgi:hypothetical protein